MINFPKQSRDRLFLELKAIIHTEINKTFAYHVDYLNISVYSKRVVMLGFFMFAVIVPSSHSLCDTCL
jgi:hypothetical protein